jgi:hypothetical protein
LSIVRRPAVATSSVISTTRTSNCARRTMLKL